MKIRRNLVSRIQTLLMIRRRRRREADGKKAGDWQDLSPESPPLPDLELSIDGHKTIMKQENSIQTQPVYNCSENSRLQRLYTIQEESEMGSLNNSRHHGQMQSNSTSSHRQSDDDPASQVSIISTSSGGLFFGPPIEWAKEQHQASSNANESRLTGDERFCKIRLFRMAWVMHDKAQKSSRSKDRAIIRTKISFDENDNVNYFRMVRPSGSNELCRFIGNSQFIPPELATHGIYDPSLADVWTMGICLYQMLTGKYPFIAESDRTMLKQMTRGDFSIPQDISEDAKDLLRKMLAPYQTRVPVDIVLLHPWLKSYTSRFVSAQASNPRSKFVSSRFLVRAMQLFVYGPYPPPKRPYQELFLDHQHQNNHF